MVITRLICYLARITSRIIVIAVILAIVMAGLGLNRSAVAAKLEPLVPVCGLADIYLGAGVGGYMQDNITLGRQIVKKTLAVLRKVQGNQIEILDPGKYLLDWRSLKLWNIGERKLSPRRAVEYGAPDFWNLYKWYFIGGGFAMLTSMMTLSVIDFRESKRAEMELARFDCLHLVGEIAASTSNGIYNPFTTIRGYLQLLQRKQQFQNQKETLNVMIGELDWANGMFSEFLSLAKNKTIKPAFHQINHLIESLLPILQAEANLRGNQIEFVPCDAPDVLFDEREVRQVILNLVMNGLEVMQGHGVLVIRTQRDQDNVVLSISDQGPRIQDEVARKIGTPFFTTKPHGTGLGLSVCFAIAERHGARLTFETSLQGTTFHFSLPVPQRSFETQDLIG